LTTVGPHSARDQQRFARNQLRVRIEGGKNGGMDHEFPLQYRYKIEFELHGADGRKRAAKAFSDLKATTPLRGDNPRLAGRG
jgi:hypothetical protein